ncbi:ATP-binding protein [Rugamonas sp.]|uniref:ATP-binding protein n=1 Tax=Rugamonas sp. TaxID=1926287 RepID=UPI0025D44A5B|nr:ATP-binding protein [Rugamonas sp.]
MTPPDTRPVAAATLATCADEPIHLPGSIQSHGALLVFDRAQLLTAWSGNAPELLQLSLSLGLPLAAIGLAPAVLDIIASCVNDNADGESVHTAVETTIAAHQFDCIVHTYLGRILIEYERRTVASETVAMFAVKAHAAIERLKREKSVTALLQMAAEQVRALTGFDRVMGYRFRHDDSGEVAAEARRADLAPLLGMRYPPGDIPAQARRLYIINTLRLISDVNEPPQPMVGRDGDSPIDMSHCVLRSVSPIHIEYLQNMGVGASMSISIVINDKLWGMLACHHLAPKQVPYSIRMATEVMVQVLAASVQLLEARQRTQLIEQSTALRSHLMEAMLSDDDMLQSLSEHAAPLCAMLAAEVLIVSLHDRILIHGEVDRSLATAIVKSLARHEEDLVLRDARVAWPPELADGLGKWIGMLAMCFDRASNGWMIVLRAEQIEEVRWGGKPEKITVHGPLGPRLTPRGSFEEWCQTVMGLAKPWDHTHVIIAQQLLGEMHRASIARHVETERAREQLFAMLGHDLRDPLNAISMAATVLELGGEPKEIGRRIRRSSSRMGRLVGQILDVSRIDRGIGLGMQRERVNLSVVLDDIVDEARTGHPATDYRLDAASGVFIHADADRLTQVISNLLNNARSHGDPAHPVSIELYRRPQHAVLVIGNVGTAIDADLVPALYDPFKRVSLDNARNRGGMGLGLHIVRQIVLEHGGSITYHYDQPQVIFTVVLPLDG